MKSRSTKTPPQLNIMKAEAVPAKDLASSTLHASSTDDNQTRRTGYKQPPIERQFKKGQSGNPLGRPPKLRLGKSPLSLTGLLDQLSAELERAHYDPSIGLDLGETMISVVVRNAISQAAEGNPKAFQNLTNFLSKIKALELNDKKLKREAAIKYRTEKLEEIQDCQSRGVNFDHIVPHPDHIFIDHEGYVRVIGPKDFTEKREWDRLANEREKHVQRVANFTERLTQDLSPDMIESLQAKKEAHEKRIEHINCIIPIFYTPSHFKGIYAQNYRQEEGSVLELDPADLSQQEREVLSTALTKVKPAKAGDQDQWRRNFRPD